MTQPYPVPPPYGPPPGYGHPYAPPFPPGPPVRLANPVGMVVALLGGVMVLVGGFADWYDNDVTLGRIVGVLDADGAKALPKAYFGWLMWVIVAATVVAALFANLPHGASGTLRVAAPVLGVLGAVLVFVSLNDLRVRGSVLDDSQVGLYLTLAGFLVAGVGGVFGPRRLR